MQKYKFYIRVYLKGGNKSEDRRFLGTKSGRIFLEILKQNSHIYKGQKHICVWVLWYKFIYFTFPKLSM